MLNLLVAIALVTATFLIALGVLAIVSMTDHRRTSRLRAFSQKEREQIVFIFDGDKLLDATPPARKFLESAPEPGSGWEHLAALLSPRFSRINALIGNLAELGSMDLMSQDGTTQLHAEWHDGIARISLDAAAPDENLSNLDRYSLQAMRNELSTLRSLTSATPHPVWAETEDGVISWCNRAYLDIADSLRAGDSVRPWPPEKLFELEDSTQDSPQRTALRDASGNTRWFDVERHKTDTGAHYFWAIPADALVRAEQSLQEFVTTVTKTFAALPIGLAIFDKSRELALFNPALLDLTGLPAGFLVAKPQFTTFLDKLHEARMTPEPKDYKSWRQQMSDLEQAARNGTYEEIWPLASGVTYRVTGRPHPDGAVALLFEDISTEISVARRFRSELEIGQSTLDALPEAIAVFTPGGFLSITNKAYAELWQDDPSTTLAEVSIDDTLAQWRQMTAPNLAWEKLHEFVSKSGHRTEWSSSILLKDGRAITLRAAPLAGGATLVGFTEAAGKHRDAPLKIFKENSIRAKA